ncbi:Cytochrome b-245 light chain [Brachionus plicatilis]|uniref:Cytochrome b-245 light chain n=1 Tax=Brachionus plicatilis TaxID=10195 RepID=A0A3M7SUS3_BRAPC|nr:Cytochrome b-245 light chain [Brachionus plicatilis]
MASILWSFFANQHGIITAPLLFIGGLLAIIGRYFWWPVGIYTLVLSFLVFVFEYPKSGRPPSSRNLTQTNHSRPYQQFLANLLSKLGCFYVNYLPRSIMYFVLGIPCLLSLSTILPGINLLITAILYLIGFFKKECWVKIEQKEEMYRRITVLQAPERPPPRTFSELN